MGRDTQCLNGWGMMLTKTLLYVGWARTRPVEQENLCEKRNNSSLEIDHGITGPWVMSCLVIGLCSPTSLSPDLG